MIVAGVLAGYALVGAVFAVAFVLRGIGRVDPVARGSGVGFRLVVVPGAAALWPVLLRKWMEAKS